MNTIRRNSVFFFLFFVLFSNAIKGQNVIYNTSDSLIYEDYIKTFSKDEKKPFSELIINTAKYFLEKPYVASTLEVSDNETLIVNLRELDCTTFMENCVALSGIIKFGRSSLDDYSALLTYIRYRAGEIDGYTSRLHYTSDWAYENEEKGILKNISGEISGQVILKTINFMSTHPQSYKHLKDNKENISKIKKIEDSINSRKAYIVIPVSAIPVSSKEIQNGDIVAFATSADGLDYSHVGIAYWENEQLHFIHASSKMKKVVIEQKTLFEYCNDSKGCTGISIFRINN
ncbi:N-acetylmuramoyl-L-alanine amidase-like domain-containing protein [Dysgonomonas reticulitermitis]